MPGASLITPSIYFGLQLVEAGETTPTHRPVTSAVLCVVATGEGYTAGGGEGATMPPGALALPPAWTYHDHGNPGDAPVVWLDGLDLPIVNLFGASFAEGYPGERQQVTRPEGPAESFKFPYSRSRDALDRLYRNGPVDPCHGIKMQ